MAIGALILVGLAVVFALIVFWVLRKGRRLPGDHVFRASRLSRARRSNAVNLNIPNVGMDPIRSSQPRRRMKYSLTGREPVML